MDIQLDATSPVPPYEQVKARIADLARTGRLAVGTRLPTVRQLATDLGLAANTVARAYRELEHEHVLETRGRHGTFVAAPDTSVTRQAQAAAAAYAQKIRSLGVNPADALGMVRNALGIHDH